MESDVMLWECDTQVLNPDQTAGPRVRKVVLERRRHSRDA